MPVLVPMRPASGKPRSAERAGRSRAIRAHHGALAIDRKIEAVGPGLVRMVQEYSVAGDYLGHLVTGPQWLFSLVLVLGGRARFPVGGRTIEPPRSFGLFIPRFTLVQFDMSRCRVHSIGFLGEAELARAPDRAVQFPIRAGVREPAGSVDIDRLLAGADPVDVSQTLAPGSLAARAKRLLDAHCERPLSVAELARRLGVAPATVSRRFRRDVGLPPLEYRHRLQIMSALMRLAGGAGIAGAAFDVGFRDLGSFYRRFRKLVSTPPSHYRTAR
jgi:AraC-like DNA-binding protein